jgi:soluble lytic murein transglycosylase-like protein
VIPHEAGRFRDPNEKERLMRHGIATVLFAVAAVAAPAFASPKTTVTTVQPVAQLAAQAFPAPMPQYLAGIINDASRQYSVDPNLIAAMAFRESAFNPNAVSSRGAQGLMQLMPKTARALGVHDSFDPRDNIFGGTRYLKTLLDRFHGDVDLTLAAYNAGPELVAKVGARPNREAIDYVTAVKSFYQLALAAL